MEKVQVKNKFSLYSLIKWIVFAIFILYAVSLLVPFLWMIMNMFKGVGEFNSGNYFGLPKSLVFANLIEVLNFTANGQKVYEMFIMSVITTVLGTAIHVFFSVVSAYCVAKYQFPGRKVILSVAIFTMILPIVGTLPAQVKMMETFGINNTLFGVLFLYSGCFSFNFILLHSSFESISWTYAEAAEIDGATRFQILFQIMIPLAQGSIIAVTILQAIGLWNDYSTPFLFLGEKQTLAVGLQILQAEMKEQYPLIFTAIIVTILPIFILFACFEKVIMENTVAGGLKG